MLTPLTGHGYCRAEGPAQEDLPEERTGRRAGLQEGAIGPSFNSLMLRCHLSAAGGVAWILDSTLIIRIIDETHLL